MSEEWGRDVNFPSFAKRERLKALAQHDMVTEITSLELGPTYVLLRIQS